MATFVWTAVFVILIFELIVTALLVLPLPRFFRRFLARKIFTYNLAMRVRFMCNFLIFGLLLAVSEAVTTLRRLELKDAAPSDGKTNGYSEGKVGYIGASFDKQRKFRAERNVLLALYVYLAGFALTLMFVIARIVELMQESFNQEEDKQYLEQQLKDVGDAASVATGGTITTDISSPSKDSGGVLRQRQTTITGSNKND